MSLITCQTQPFSGSSVLLSVLALLDCTVLAIQQRLPVLVQLELGNHDLGRVDGDWYGLPVGLVPRDALHMDAELLAVHLSDLSLTVMVVSPDDDHLVVAADRHCPHVVLVAELLARYVGTSLQKIVHHLFQVTGGDSTCEFTRQQTNVNKPMYPENWL